MAGQGGSPFGRQTPEGFIPLSAFADKPFFMTSEVAPGGTTSSEMGQKYNEWEAAYRGFILGKRAGPNMGDPLIYPFKLNIIRPAVILHAAGLLGQLNDHGIVQFGVQTKTAGITPEQSDGLSRIMNLLWSLNYGDQGFLEQAIFQQKFGGYFYQVRWKPERPKWPIGYTVVDPRFCYPVWDSQNYNILISMDTHYMIPRINKPIDNYLSDPNIVTPGNAEAIPHSALVSPEEYVAVHEHWDEYEYALFLDGKIAVNSKGEQVRGPNPFYDPVENRKVVPFCYTPRLRSGTFYGDSLVPGLLGGQEQINNSLGHLLDGLADSMHQQPWVRNVIKGVASLRNASRDDFLNLGSRQFNGGDPEVGRLEAADFNPSVVDFVTDDMPAMLREHNGMPDVAWGKTDASIRSALTMAFMMKPFSDYVVHYRTNAKAGMKRLNHIMMAVVSSVLSSMPGRSSLGNSSGIGGITPERAIEIIAVGHETHLPPSLPQDRIDLVNEMSVRLAAGAIDPQTAIERLDGRDEADNIWARVQQMQAELRAHEERLAEKGQMARRGNGGSASSSPNSNRSKADGGRKS